MTIKDVILNAEKLNEEAVVYGKKIDGRFKSCFELISL